MKLLLLALGFVTASMPLLSVEVGDTYEKVVDEKGMPTSKMDVGGVLTLNYADATIKLSQGKVSWIKMAGAEAGDSYKKVVEEKGAPMSKMEAGASLILNYTDVTIKFHDGKVVSIKQVGAGAGIMSAAPKLQPIAAESEWTTDYAAALRQAKTEKKQVFLFFTGSDWCGWCKRLDREILATSDFKAYARAHLILVKVDFPRSLPQSAQLKASNQKLGEKYQIEGYPTIVVLDSSGKDVGKLGYEEGGPGAFISELKKL
jgi:protein disulfide-isomerase